MNSIGWAIEQIRNGERVCRRGWNGKGMWIAYSPGRPDGLPKEHFWSPANQAYADSLPNGMAPVLPCITMRTADGSILMGWLASQTDLLATDWEVALD
jgi:hypothetical protein